MQTTGPRRYGLHEVILMLVELEQENALCFWESSCDLYGQPWPISSVLVYLVCGGVLSARSLGREIEVISWGGF